VAQGGRQRENLSEERGTGVQQIQAVGGKIWKVGVLKDWSNGAME
jgi:hypothetical protein